MSPKASGSPATKLTKAEMSPQATYGKGGDPGCKKLNIIKITNTGFTYHNHPVKRGECVQWKNLTGQARTLTFSRWPFTEPWQAINVPANGTSNVYHVAQVPDGKYPYVPNPALAVGPPDPPGVVVGG
jgi:plastocyanin